MGGKLSFVDEVKKSMGLLVGSGVSDSSGAIESIGCDHGGRMVPGAGVLRREESVTQ